MIEISIDAAGLARVAAEFGASEAQLRAALKRAENRTAQRLRTMARKALREGLALRSAAVLKARLRLRRSRVGASLWVGLNNLPASAFKGRPRASGGGVSAGGRQFSGAFIGRGQDSGSAQAFRRTGASRLPIEVVTVPIKDEADSILEAQVMREAADSFMQAFVAEVRARTIYGVGG